MKPSVEMLIERYRNNLYVMAFSVCKNTQDAAGYHKFEDPDSWGSN